VQSGKNQQKFYREYVSLILRDRRLSQGTIETSVKQAASRAGSLLASLFRLEGEGDIFLRNVSWLQRTTWHYIPDDRTLHNHCCENISYFFWRSSARRTWNCKALLWWPFRIAVLWTRQSHFICKSFFAGDGNQGDSAPSLVHTSLRTWEPLKYNSVTSACDRWLMNGSKTSTWVHRLTTEWCSCWYHQ
jgi:hypothetical protein